MEYVVLDLAESLFDGKIAVGSKKISASKPLVMTVDEDSSEDSQESDTRKRAAKENMDSIAKYSKNVKSRGTTGAAFASIANTIQERFLGERRVPKPAIALSVERLQKMDSVGPKLGFYIRQLRKSADVPDIFMALVKDEDALEFLDAMDS